MQVQLKIYSISFCFSLSPFPIVKNKKVSLAEQSEKQRNKNCEQLWQTHKVAKFIINHKTVYSKLNEVISLHLLKNLQVQKLFFAPILICC